MIQKGINNSYEHCDKLCENSNYLLCLFVSEEESQITEHVLWAMAAFLPGFALPVLTLLFILKRRHTTKPPEDTSDRSEASLSLNLMNMSQET